MPIFEYKCKECGAKYEVLHRSANNQKTPVCPECDSEKSEKLLSSFAASVPQDASMSFDACADGNCGAPSTSSDSGCASGMCGLN